MTVLAVIDQSSDAARRTRAPRRIGTTIERSFLIDRIRNGIAGQVVVLQAPPGFGKTELLAAASAVLPMLGDRFAWLTLSPADADPLIFLDDVASACGVQLPSARQANGFEAALERLFDRLARDSGRRVIVLDEFQTAGSEAFAACMASFFRHLPDNVRLVIASHRRPNIPVSRFRLRGLLTEILASDLAFSRSEMKQLVAKRLSTAEFDAFAEATGGWPALVQLAVPLFAEAGDKEARSEIIAGTHRIFRDFIFEEIVPQVPSDLREALAVCSILTEFPLDLASHLADVEVETRPLQDLEDFAPIIVPVEHRPGWFRLHPVVRAAFSSQLQLYPSERVAALHSRAASWFAARDHIEKAVIHASRAGDFGLAAEAIRQAGGVGLFIRAGHTVLERLIASIPAAGIHRSPSLMLCYALVLAKQGRIQPAREIIVDLRKADDAIHKAAFSALPVNALDHIEGLIDVYEDCHFEEAHVEWLEKAVGELGPRDTWERGWIFNQLTIVYTRSGALEMARTSALKSLACYREEMTAYGQIFMIIHMSLISVLAGRPSTANMFAREAEEIIQRTQWSDRNILAIAHIPLAEAFYQQAQVKTADAMMREAMPYLARGEGWVDLFVRGYGTLARCQLNLASIEAALGVMDRAEQVAIDRNLHRLRLAVDIIRVELLTRAGLLESAAHLRRSLPSLDDEALWPTWREWSDAAIVHARLLSRTGQPLIAIDYLEALRARSVEHDRGAHLLLGTVVAIEARWAAGHQEEALAALQHAVALARPQECLQVFLDEGQPLAQAIRGIIRRFGLSTFSAATADFVSRASGSAKPSDSDSAGGPIGLLSPREAEVLEFLAKGSANKEIARDLGLAEATVKFHLKNLYAKLGVSRRSLAISVARRMGLVEAS